MDLKNKVSEIHELISSNKISVAILKCKKLLKKYPNNSYITNLYGLVLQTNGEILKSIKQFEKSILYDANNIAAMNNLANSYKNLYQYEKAEELYKKIIIENKTNVKVLNNYANLKKDFNKYNEAKNLLLEALQIEQNNTDILFNIASCCHGMGEIDEAKNYALKIQSLQPQNAANHRFLSSIIDYKEEPGHLEIMKEILFSKKHLNYSEIEKSDLYFALGKAYEDIKDFENSYKFLSKANSIKKQNSDYDIKKTEKLFNSLIKLFNILEKKSYKKYQSNKKIIFICGMPRSGTTLIEQIIASHSKVRGAGELHYLSKIINENFLEELKFNKQKIEEELSSEKYTILEQYLELLKFHNFDEDIITDKAPQNFIWIGFINFFFPNSKIIHCSRNPKDNCLSLYKNYFPSQTMSWAYDQIEIAKYYKLYIKLMNFWKSKFKDFIFDASYENIVNNSEPEIKKMISFCDLSWEPGCLKFYQNKKTPVQTVSVSQANKPIYKSSVNSNQGYSDYLQEMFHNLDTK